MRENLNYYLALPSVVKGDVVDLEAQVQQILLEPFTNNINLPKTKILKTMLWT